MNDKTLKEKEFKKIIDQLFPEALEDLLKFSRYLAARQIGLYPLAETIAILELLTPENVKQVRNFGRDVIHKQIQLEGAPKMDFKKRNKRKS